MERHGRRSCWMLLLSLGFLALGRGASAQTVEYMGPALELSVTEDGQPRSLQADHFTLVGREKPGTVLLAREGVLYEMDLAPFLEAFPQLSEESLLLRENLTGLGSGSAGEAVRALQEELSLLGSYQGEPSGVFDGPTLEAVKAFQKTYELPDTGYAGKATLLLIEQAREGILGQTFSISPQGDVLVFLEDGKGSESEEAEAETEAETRSEEETFFEETVSTEAPAEPTTEAWKAAVPVSAGGQPAEIEPEAVPGEEAPEQESAGEALTEWQQETAPAPVKPTVKQRFPQLASAGKKSLKPFVDESWVLDYDIFTGKGTLSNGFVIGEVTDGSSTMERITLRASFAVKAEKRDGELFLVPVLRFRSEGALRPYLQSAALLSGEEYCLLPEGESRTWTEGVTTFEETDFALTKGALALMEKSGNLQVQGKGRNRSFVLSCRAEEELKQAYTQAASGLVMEDE